MIDTIYQQALATLEHHLEEAGAAYSLDDGELLVSGHRVGISVTFDGFVAQGAHQLAPLDVQIHVDGDSGDRFRVGTLGVGNNEAAALQDAIFEWHLLAAAPLLAALGAPVENRRASTPPARLAGWDLFAGRIGIRGNVPAELRAGGAFYRTLLDRLRQFVSSWPDPTGFQLRSLFIMAAAGPEGTEIQAAVDGLVDAALVESLSTLAWPASGESYLYKQLFILRSGA